MSKYNYFKTILGNDYYNCNIGKQGMIFVNNEVARNTIVINTRLTKANNKLKHHHITYIGDKFCLFENETRKLIEAGSFKNIYKLALRKEYLNNDNRD